MEPAVRKLTIKTLQSRIATLKIVCDGYSKQFEDGTLDQAQKSEIAHRWDAALKEIRALLLALDRLEREEKLSKIEQE